MIDLASKLALALLSQASPAPQGPTNGDFERTQSDAEGWRVSTPGFAVEIESEGVHGGAHCARLYPSGAEKTAGFGNLLQSFDARPWRALPIRLRAAIRIQGPETRAQMWLRVDRPNRDLGLFDNMGNRPVRSTEWSIHEITGIVDPDAEQLTFGVMVFGPGEVWVDDVVLEPTGPAVPYATPEAPSELEERGLANLLAFAELYGYVRHFHPSDQAAEADWDEVAQRGVRAVESARDAAELARRLQQVFGALAPTVRVFVSHGSPEGTEAAPERAELRTVRWKHVGFGQPGGAYSSKREWSRKGQEPEPVEPYRAQLAGGVSCLVPLVLHADEDGTLPRVEPRPDETAPQLARPGNDRGIRLADVVIAWNVFQHFYPYFDVTPIDWEAELERALRSAATDADEREFGKTLRRLVAALGDGHGYVHHSSLRAAGFLPLAWDWVEGRLTVTRVARGLERPAPGDVVIALDGEPVEEVLARVEASISGATPQWRRLTALLDLARPASPAAIKLRLQTYADGEEAEVVLEPGPTPPELESGLPEKICQLEPGLWYVDLDRATDAEIQAVVPELADAEGIVFDLRGYPRGVQPQTIFGHIIRTPVTSAQWNFPILSRPNREEIAFERRGEWQLSPVEPYFQAKKAFLIGGGAISYAESCLGIVEHYRLAELVGAPTAGTNGNVNPFELPGGYTVSWTGMKVLKQDGSRHHGVGIQPTIPVAPTRAGVAEGRDEVLERAVEAVRQ